MTIKVASRFTGSCLNSLDVVVISLRNELDRRKNMSVQLSGLGINYAFLDAVDGRGLGSPPVEYDSEKRRRHYGYDLSPGEIGCFLSHKLVWRHCLEYQKSVLVLEDDIIFDSDFRKSLDLISCLDTSYEMLRLSGLTNRDNARVILTNLGRWNFVEELKDPGGSGAYILTPEGALKLFSSSATFSEPVDNFLENRRLHGLKIRSLVPYPVQQNVFPSTIQDRFARPKSLKHRLRRLLFRSLQDTCKLIWAFNRKRELKEELRRNFTSQVAKK